MCAFIEWLSWFSYLYTIWSDDVYYYGDLSQAMFWRERYYDKMFMMVLYMIMLALWIMMKIYDMIDMVWFMFYWHDACHLIKQLNIS